MLLIRSTQDLAALCVHRKRPTAAFYALVSLPDDRSRVGGD